MTTTKQFLGVTCSTKKPTLQHRPAVWECMLGTVYALNDEGECRYFDYDHEGALAFAGVAGDIDVRLHKGTVDRSCGYVRSGRTEANPRVGKRVLWVPRGARKVSYTNGN